MLKNRERKPDFNSQQFDYIYLTFEQLSSGQAVSLYHWSHNMLSVGVSQLQQVAAYPTGQGHPGSALQRLFLQSGILCRCPCPIFSPRGMLENP